jgi:hypothetical protein
MQRRELAVLTAIADHEKELADGVKLAELLLAQRPVIAAAKGAVIGRAQDRRHAHPAFDRAGQCRRHRVIGDLPSTSANARIARSRSSSRAFHRNGARGNV